MLPVSPSTFRLPYTFLLPPESGASDIDDRVTSPRLSRSSQSCKTQAMSLSPRQGLNIVVLGGDSLNRSLSIAHRLPSTACPEPCRRVHRHSSVVPQERLPSSLFFDKITASLRKMPPWHPQSTINNLRVPDSLQGKSKILFSLSFCDRIPPLFHTLVPTETLWTSN